MRMRLLAIVSAMLVAIVAFPFAATAQAPNTARISSTSYVDTAGYETMGLCDTETMETTIIEAIVSYSGVGPELGGTGTGEIEIVVGGESFEFDGTIEIDGETAYVQGGGTMFCLLPGYAFVFGEFVAYGDEPVDNGPVVLQLEPGEVVCGGLTGTIQDGAHPNQGRVSFTLNGADTECLAGA